MLCPGLSLVAVGAGFLSRAIGTPPSAIPAAQDCQISTPPNTTAQEFLDVKCNIDEAAESCSCHIRRNFMGGLSHWIYITKEEVERLHAPKGFWYPLDTSEHCMAVVPPEPATPLPCPPGFYCDGGRLPPKSCQSGDFCPGETARLSCPKGRFCPVPAGPILECPDGGYCPGGSTMPELCPVGFFCTNTEIFACPGGYYCPMGSSEKRGCSILSFCPPRTGHQVETLPAILFLLTCAGMLYAGAKHYHLLVRKGYWGCLACATGVLVMWLVDGSIALFLSLLFFVVAANWASLKMEFCPPAVAPLIMSVTVVVALYVLWRVQKAWSLLVGNICLCSTLGWLMARQNKTLVLVGRGLLVLAFIVLLAVFIKVDPGFVINFIVLLVIIVLALLSSWAWEQYRSVERLPALPKVPWKTSRSGNAAQARDCVEMSELGSKGTGAAFLGGTPGSTTDSRTAGGVAGVSFHLADLDFDLPDGKRLLKNIRLKIDPGRRVAVMGPSGSGKSTLLAVLSGRASYGEVSGELRVSGRPADDLRFLKNVTGFVPQDDVLHGELTVEENIRFQAALRLPAGTPVEKASENAVKVAEDLNLSRILTERVGNAERRGISGGQRKRVSIAMELVAQPLLLFADEPTSGLDSTTSHEVVRCLNDAAASLGATVLAVIHQPRYETLCLFDDLVLLGTGGCLVYSGPTEAAREHFKTKLSIAFPPNNNPGDIFLDSIQPPHSPDACAEVWRNCAESQCELEETEPTPAEVFVRQRVPFFKAVLVYMDRAMIQSICSYRLHFVNQGLSVGATFVLCKIIVYERVDQFIMQSSFAALSLMLLQGVAGQRIFGADLLITWREARVGMPMAAYFVAKDLAALFEVTLTAAVFSVAYGSMSGMQLSMSSLFAGTWAFVYAVFGYSYIFSIVLSSGAAQMSAVVSSFIAFCVAGVIKPELPEIAAMLEGRAWMIPALSPIRWYFGFLFTAEIPHLSFANREGARKFILSKGYDIDLLSVCQHSMLGPSDTAFATLEEAWQAKRCWVCNTAPLLLLGLILRFLAAVSLMLAVNAHTSGWAHFFAQSDQGAWKFAGRLFALFTGSFLLVFLFAEIYIMGILDTENL